MEKTIDKATIGIMNNEAIASLSDKPSIDRLYRKMYYTESQVEEAQKELDCASMSMSDYMKKCNENRGTEIALTYLSAEITYGEFFAAIEKSAKAFKQIGVQKGDKVSLCMINSPEMVYALYALNQIGAVAHMVHPAASKNEMIEHLNKVDSKVLVMFDGFYDKIREFIGETTIQNAIIVPAMNSVKYGKNRKINMLKAAERLKGIRIPKNSIYTSWDTFIESGSNYLADYKVDGTYNDDAVIVYTGGTTGASKAVVITNKGFNAMAIQIRKYTGDIHGEKVLNNTPSCLAYGVNNCLNMPICLGGNTVLEPKADPKTFCDDILRLKPNYVQVSPVFWEAFVKDKRFKNIDLSFLKKVVSGGDTLSPQLRAQVNEILKNGNSHAELIDGYGSSELSGCAGVEDIPLLLTEVKIINPETKKECDYEEPGEITFSGPTVMKGYYGNEALTGKVITQDEHGKEWLQTRDVGKITKEGKIQMSDRLERIILAFAEDGTPCKLFPSEVQGIITKHPLVSDCVVLETPDEKRKAILKAYLVLKENVQKTRQLKAEIEKLCSDNLAEYAVPMEYIVVREFPRTEKELKVDQKRLSQMKELTRFGSLSDRVKQLVLK